VELEETPCSIVGLRGSGRTLTYLIFIQLRIKMNQYCFDVTVPKGTKVNIEGLKQFVEGLYTGNEPKFVKDEVPISAVIYSQVDSNICVLMKSRGKANIARMEEINSKMKPVQLKYGDISLAKPYLYTEVEQTWHKGEAAACKKGDKQWNSIVQQGPYFVDLLEPYQPLGAVLVYNKGTKYKLTAKQEKIAGFYAKRLISEQKGGVTIFLTEDPVFNKNFWNSFQKYLTAEQKKEIKDFKLDFSDLINKIEANKEKAVDKKEKKVGTEERKKAYGYAVLDGAKEKVGGFAVEPAGIFMGRGNNPNRGKVKTEVLPEDVIINIGEKDPVPRPPAGHKWKEVTHDHCGQWLAKWKDTITGEPKYIRFHAEGKFKGMSDLVKYEKARKLERHIDAVRTGYMADSASKNKTKKQLGTVMYLIDHYGLRVGGEKDEEKEADTVGASTLKVGNVSLDPPFNIILDFLGKDSIRFYKVLEVPLVIYSNIAEFIKSRGNQASLFDQISALDINKYLKTFDVDFSAKVFRTRLASVNMANGLAKTKVPNSSTKETIRMLFNKANSKVAELLNHTRTVSKKAEEAVGKERVNLDELKNERKAIQKKKGSLAVIDEKIKKIEEKIEGKTNVLAVAITTSLTNYIDPRIVVSWSERHKISPAVVYPKTLLTKFRWAVDTTDSNWDYFTSPLIGNPELEPTVEGASGPSVKKSRRPGAPPRKSPVAKSRAKSRAKPISPSPFRPVKTGRHIWIGPGKESEYQILLDYCNNPRDKTKLYLVSKPVFEWVYDLIKAKGIASTNTAVTNFLVSFHEKL
jgi:DNA topoisomerase-1